MKLREQLVLELLEPGANHSEVCRRHGVSRQVGYKWLKRYRQGGWDGLADQSRRPHRSPLRVSAEVVLQVLTLRAEHPGWGPQKLQSVLQKRGHPMPHERTVARILERAGVARRRTGRHGKLKRSAPTQAPQVPVRGPNDLWTIDFKGWWKTADGCRCEPLTVRDAYSRYVLSLQCMASTALGPAQTHIDTLFERYGLPKAIQVDNGTPFVSVHARDGLTRLSAWWVSLGIQVVRGRPARPQDNGAHERLHADIAFELELYPEATRQAQQHACDRWRHDFNHVRPHQALDLKVPSDLYRRSRRPYRGSRAVRYADCMTARKVTTKGRVYYQGHVLTVSRSLVGYTVGIEPTDLSHVRVWFYERDLGLFVLPNVA